MEGERKRSILLTGGAGYIGSHTCLQYLEHVYNLGDMEEMDIIIIDNLLNADEENINNIRELYSHVTFHFYKNDLCHLLEIEEIFKNHNIESIIHFAGLKAVGESNKYPLLYYSNNLLSTFNILFLSEKYNVKYFIFSSSATVYGSPIHYLPIDEYHPLNPTNPYGRTKLMIEQIIEDFYKSNKTLDIIILRYFNPVSCHPLGILKENPKGRPNNLFPYISRVYQKEYKKLDVFGNDYNTPDGTGVRDYIHVSDLAEAHIASLQYLKNRDRIDNKNIMKIYNVGTGMGYSVLEMIDMFEKVSNEKIEYEIKERREGDIAECYALSEKIFNELGWKSRYNLEDMVTHEINRIKKKICEKEIE